MIQLLLVILGFTVFGITIYRDAAQNVVSFRRPERKTALDHEISQYLQQIAFYKTLNAEEQRTFIDRVKYFQREKDFQGMQGQVITDEIRTIVAASAVQLTFRLPMWEFPSYHTFRIYPESFYSNLFRKYLKGGAGRTGQIWFSLQDYRSGFADAENGINLGLHEMAHALIIEMENGNLDHEFTHAYEKIETIAKDRIPKIRNKSFTYLREYAGTNPMEFIAVTTEYFFEQPAKLSAADRELYEAFSDLYRIDSVPAKSASTVITPVDYEEIEKTEKIKRNYRFARWHWSLTLALIGIFIAPAFLAFQLQYVALSFGLKWVIAGIVLVISAAFLYKPIVKSGALGSTQFFLCHFVGLWPLVFAAVMLVNNLIPVWKQGEVHEIRKINWQNTAKAIVSFTDDAYAADEYMRVINGLTPGNLNVGDYVIVVHQYGLFGIPVYGDNLVVKVPPKK